MSDHFKKRSGNEACLAQEHSTPAGSASVCLLTCWYV